MFERCLSYFIVWGEPNGWSSCGKILCMQSDCIPENLQDALRSPRFTECLFITRCNEPVGAYALQRARLFARANRVQLLWIQAEDYLDDPHFADLSFAEKVKRKKPWLSAHFHTRRTGGVPSLLPICYDLPVRCQFANYGGQSKKLKEHGIYTQARCRIRGWELHESDMQILEENTDPEVILQHMPKTHLC